MLELLKIDWVEDAASRMNNLVREWNEANPNRPMAIEWGTGSDPNEYPPDHQILRKVGIINLSSNDLELEFENDFGGMVSVSLTLLFGDYDVPLIPRVLSELNSFVDGRPLLRYDESDPTLLKLYGVTVEHLPVHTMSWETLDRHIMRLADMLDDIYELLSDAVNGAI